MKEKTTYVCYNLDGIARRVGFYTLAEAARWAKGFRDFHQTTEVWIYDKWTLQDELGYPIS